VVKPARTAFQERQIVQGVEDVLVSLIAAWMASNDGVLMQNVHPEWVRLHGKYPCSSVRGDGIPIGFEGNLTIGGEARVERDAAGKVVRRQRAQVWHFLLPCGDDGLRFARHRAGVIFPALCQEQRVEVVIGLDRRDGHEKIAAAEPNGVLHLPFLMRLAHVAEDAVEEIVAAEGEECGLLLACATLHDVLGGGLEVVVPDALGNPADMVKRCHMAGKEALLLLRGEGHHKGATGVAEPQDKEMHREAHPPDVCHCLPPIYLGVAAWVERQGKIGRRHLAGLAQVAHIAADRGLTAGVAFVSKNLADAPRGVALLARQAVVLVKQLLDARFEGIELGRWAWVFHLIAWRLGMIEGFAHTLPSDAKVMGNVVDRVVLNVVSVAYLGVLIHLEHLL
jgi:hypothetical protein